MLQSRSNALFSLLSFSYIFSSLSKDVHVLFSLRAKLNRSQWRTRKSGRSSSRRSVALVSSRRSTTKQKRKWRKPSKRRNTRIIGKKVFRAVSLHKHAFLSLSLDLQHYFSSTGIAAERKEAKQEKDEAEKYRRLHDEFSLTRLQVMLFKLFYNQREMEAIREETEVCLSHRSLCIGRHLHDCNFS